MKFKTIISDSYRNKLSSSGVPELMVFAGSVYETNLSRVLISTHQLTSLRGKCVYGREVFQAKASMESVLEVKESSKLPFEWATSCNLQDNICYTMPSRNSQSIDAFVIRGDVVFFLQATVASRHPVKLPGLISVFSTLQKLCPRVQACELVFLAPFAATQVIAKIQPLHGSDNKNISDVSSLGLQFHNLLTRQWILRTSI